MKNTDQKPEFQYAVKIVNAIQQMFDEDSDSPIDQEELKQGDNLTHFIHALANVAPTMIYNNLTSNKENQLSFNHIANTLCHQYSNKK